MPQLDSEEIHRMLEAWKDHLVYLLHLWTVNSAGAQRRDLPGSHSGCQNSECQQKSEQGHPKRKFLLNHAPPHAFYLLWPSAFISLSPGFCNSFQNPVTQGYCHIEIELTTMPLGGSRALWVEAPCLWHFILFPSQRFQPLGGLTLTRFQDF